MVLTALAALAVLKRDRLGIACLRLRDIARGIAEDFQAHGIDFFLRGQMAITTEINPLAVETTDCEFLDIGKHQLALVVVAEPISRKRGQQRCLAEVVTNDLRRKGQQRAVVRELRTDGIDNGHAFFADAMDEPWNAKHRIAAENHGIKPAVGESRVNNMHLAQAGDGFQIDLVIEHQEISTLHERDSHAATEEAVLGIRRAQGAGREQHDHGIRRGRVGAEHFQNAGGNIGYRMDAGIAKRLGNNAR